MGNVPIREVMTALTSDSLAVENSSVAERRSASFWLFAILCLFSALVGRFSYMIRPFDSDGAMFIYMGRLIDEGGRFGHELIDNKFPTVGLVMSVVWRMFGTNWCQYILLQTAMSLFAAWLLARSAARHFGQHAAIPTLFFAIVHLNLNFTVFGGFQLETLQAFFEILAAGAAFEAIAGDNLADAFVVGLAAGAAAMCKPTGLAVAGIFGLTMLLFQWRRPGRLILHGLAVLAGVAIPAAVVLAYLIHSDNLRDMPELWRQISTYAKNSAWDGWDMIKPVTVSVMGGFPLFVRYVIFRREQDRVKVNYNWAKVTFVMLWFAINMTGVIAQRRMYAYHFMVLVPPVALLYGMLPRKDRLAPMAAALIPMAIFSIYGGSLVVGLTYTGEFRMEASDYIAAHTNAKDTVWMDDAPRLLLETGLHSGSRHPLMFLLANYDTAPLEYRQTILNDFARNKPKYILIPAEFEKFLKWQGHEIEELNKFPVRRENFFAAWRDIKAYTLAHYVKETRIGHDDVYRRAAP